MYSSDQEEEEDNPTSDTRKPLLSDDEWQQVFRCTYPSVDYWCEVLRQCSSVFEDCSIQWTENGVYWMFSYSLYSMLISSESNENGPFQSFYLPYTEDEDPAPIVGHLEFNTVILLRAFQEIQRHLSGSVTPKEKEKKKGDDEPSLVHDSFQLVMYQSLQNGAWFQMILTHDPDLCTVPDVLLSPVEILVPSIDKEKTYMDPEKYIHDIPTIESDVCLTGVSVAALLQESRKLLLSETGSMMSVCVGKYENGEEEDQFFYLSKEKTHGVRSVQKQEDRVTRITSDLISRPEPNAHDAWSRNIRAKRLLNSAYYFVDCSINGLHVFSSVASMDPDRHRNKKGVQVSYYKNASYMQLLYDRVQEVGVVYLMISCSETDKEATSDLRQWIV